MVRLHFRDTGDFEGLFKNKKRNVTDGIVSGIEEAMKQLEDKSNQYLTYDALTTYSPKFQKVLYNIQKDDHKGSHLIYSQFRTLEGIGILSLILNAMLNI